MTSMAILLNLNLTGSDEKEHHKLAKPDCSDMIVSLVTTGLVGIFL